MPFNDSCFEITSNDFYEICNLLLRIEGTERHETVEFICVWTGKVLHFQMSSLKLLEEILHDFIVGHDPTFYVYFHL